MLGCMFFSLALIGTNSGHWTQAMLYIADHGTGKTCLCTVCFNVILLGCIVSLYR